MNRLRFRSHSVLLVTLLICCGCDRTKTADVHDANKDSGDRIDSVMRVATVTPTRKTLVRRIEQPGEIQAFERTPLHSKVTGFINKVHVDIGDRIEAGHLMAEIAIPEYEQELQQKKSLVAQAEAETAQAKAAIKVAKAALDSSRALAVEAAATVDRYEAEFQRADAELARITALAAEKAITQKSVDEATAKHKAAQAARTESKARIVSAQAAVSEKEAAIEQAEAAARAIASKEDVAKADEQRLIAIHEYTRIVAPYDCIVTERNVDTGHLVQTGKGSTDKPLFVVVRANTVRVFVDVPETDVRLVANGCEASIRIPSAANQVIQGKVSRTSWTLNPSTRTLRAEVDVPNEEGLLRPGMYVIADLKVAEREGALSLPRTAILTKDQKAFCLAVSSDNVIVRIPVAVGIRTTDEVEITSGLTGRENIIASNLAAYKEGQPVKIATAPK